MTARAEATGPVRATGPARRPRGRRPAGQDTRAAIVEAARAEFAARGYEGTSLRAVARAAGVDPALVHHYFAGKHDLLTAALHVPVDAAAVVARVTAGGMDGAGERLVRTFLEQWEDDGRRTALLALVRSVLGSEELAALAREMVLGPLLGEVTRRLGSPDPRLSAGLAGSQLIGMAMARYVVRLEPLASAPVEKLVALYGPTVQRYLEG